MNGNDDGDDTVEIPTLHGHESADDQETAEKGMPSLDELSSLSAPERKWLVWFYALSNEDKKVVEICADKRISDNATNIEQMKRIVSSHRGPGSDSGE